MAGKEAEVFEKCIAVLLAKKQEQAYSEVCGYVRSMMAISVARLNTLPLRRPCQQFEDGTVLERLHCGNW